MICDHPCVYVGAYVFPQISHERLNGCQPNLVVGVRHGHPAPTRCPWVRGDRLDIIRL